MNLQYNRKDVRWTGHIKLNPSVLYEMLVGKLDTWSLNWSLLVGKLVGLNF